MNKTIFELLDAIDANDLKNIYELGAQVRLDIKTAQKDLPAFPCQSDLHGKMHPGLTKSEWFAAHAPEIPIWFNVEPLPEVQYPWMWLKLGRGKDADILRNWQKDPRFDLPVRLKKWEDSWKEYQEAMHKRREANTEKRFFAWRRYYGAQMTAL